jgi:hypothetical protein
MPGEHVTQGRNALKVQYTNKPQWSNVLTWKVPGDWTGFRYLNFDLWLEGRMARQFGLWIRDKAQHQAGVPSAPAAGNPIFYYLQDQEPVYAVVST